MGGFCHRCLSPEMLGGGFWKAIFLIASAIPDKRDTPPLPYLLWKRLCPLAVNVDLEILSAGPQCRNNENKGENFYRWAQLVWEGIDTAIRCERLQCGCRKIKDFVGKKNEMECCFRYQTMVVQWLILFRFWFFFLPIFIIKWFRFSFSFENKCYEFSLNWC